MKEYNKKSFLETVPPGKWITVNDFENIKASSHSCYSKSPMLYLYCENENCNGFRFFTPKKDSEYSSRDELNNIFLVYNCQNCGSFEKYFSLASFYNHEKDKWEVYKFGEIPSFGPPIPAKVYNLIGGERELFLLGRRNEMQGMGIGAFVYYRRVVESQKNRIFEELLRVIQKLNPSNPIIVDLEKAKTETQFTKAVELIKNALPQSLEINGYNPLKLLHSALSEGVHVHSDKECLDFASSIRTVLFEFSERLSNALKENSELNAAVNKLSKSKLN